MRRSVARGPRRREPRRAGRAAALGALLALGAAGCVTYQRGELGLAAVHPPPVELETVQDEVEGRSCSSLREGQYDQALENALLVAPGADALVDASWDFENFCIVVRGRAVRVRPPAPAEPGETEPGAPQPEPDAGPSPEASPAEPLPTGG